MLVVPYGRSRPPGSPYPRMDILVILKHKNSCNGSLCRLKLKFKADWGTEGGLEVGHRHRVAVDGHHNLAKHGFHEIKRQLLDLGVSG